VTDPNAWERARATLADDVSNFDVTFEGNTEGDYGFGLLWGASADQDDGYAVIVHPAQFQAIYLKQLVPGQGDIGIADTPLPPGLAGTPMTVRITRQDSQVTVWLNGTQMLSASDDGGTVQGRLGLVCSDTDLPADAGAVFTLFRVDSASEPDGGEGETDAGEDGGQPQPNGPLGVWTLAFDDEFDGTSLDATNWSSGWYSTCPTSPGVGDTTAITTSQTTGMYIGPSALSFPGDGALHITLSAPVDPQPSSGGPFSLETGQIATAGLWNLNPDSAAYTGPGQSIDGTLVFEIRARLAGPTADAADYWPAFWMTNAGNYGCGGQVYSEEVDFLEGLGNGSLGSNLELHLHAASEYGGANIVPPADDGVDYSLGYHVWTYELSPNEIQC
jgi:hypothetical protein